MSAHSHQKSAHHERPDQWVTSERCYQLVDIYYTQHPSDLLSVNALGYDPDFQCNICPVCSPKADVCPGCVICTRIHEQTLVYMKIKNVEPYVEPQAVEEPDLEENWDEDEPQFYHPVNNDSDYESDTERWGLH